MEGQHHSGSVDHFARPSEYKEDFLSYETCGPVPLSREKATALGHMFNAKDFFVSDLALVEDQEALRSAFTHLNEAGDVTAQKAALKRIESLVRATVA